MIKNWRDCLAYDVKYLFAYTVMVNKARQRESVVDFLDLLHSIYPITDKGSKFDSISQWLGDLHYTYGLITHGEYHDCLTALANNI